MNILIKKVMDYHGAAFFIRIELEYGTQYRTFELFDTKGTGISLYNWENKRVDCLIQASYPDLYESEQKMKRNEKPYSEKCQGTLLGEARFSGKLIKDYVIPSKWYKEYETIHDKLYDFKKYKDQTIYALETIFGTIILGDDEKFLPFCDYERVWLYSHRYYLLAWQELDEEGQKGIFQTKFEVNKYLYLKFKEGKTYIYINNERFIQCVRLALNIPINKIRDYREINSIDEALGIYEKFIYQNEILGVEDGNSNENGTFEITPEEEFQAHCSNLQAWYEHDYDTRLLHSNIAFPLLKKLTQAGDPLAKKQFKREIMLRIESGYEPVVKYLVEEGYLEFFDEQQKETIKQSLGRKYQLEKE